MVSCVNSSVSYIRIVVLVELKKNCLKSFFFFFKGQCSSFTHALIGIILRGP